jgi:hypothetical protein
MTMFVFEFHMTLFFPRCMFYFLKAQWFFSVSIKKFLCSRWINQWYYKIILVALERQISSIFALLTIVWTKTNKNTNLKFILLSKYLCVVFYPFKFYFKDFDFMWHLLSRNFSIYIVETFIFKSIYMLIFWNSGGQEFKKQEICFQKEYIKVIILCFYVTQRWSVTGELFYKVGIFNSPFFVKKYSLHFNKEEKSLFLPFQICPSTLAGLLHYVLSIILQNTLAFS